MISVREFSMADTAMVEEMLDALTPGWSDVLAPGASGPRAFIADPKSFMFGAYVDNEPAGFGWGAHVRYPNGKVMTYLHELLVAEEHRRKGIGTLLTNAGIDLARRSGHQRFWLSTGMHNEIAQALYDRLGGVRKELGDVNYWWELSGS